MPDILTHSTTWQLIETAPKGKFLLIGWWGADNVFQTRVARFHANHWQQPESRHWIQWPTHWKSLPEPPNAEKVSDQARAASKGSQRNLTQSEAAPETIPISLPALRSVILAVIDDGDRKRKRLFKWEGAYPWRLNEPESDIANETRLRFCDEIERRLRQLPVRG